jgi:cytochrome b involved in lipid metabolism
VEAIGLSSERRRRRSSTSSKLKLQEYDDHDSVADTASMDGSMTDDVLTCDVCDSCPHCGDQCCEIVCSSCSGDRTGPVCLQYRPGQPPLRYYTKCQVRRHNHEESAWLVAGDTIYDATSYLHRHPGGLESILRKSGGAADCTQDFEFHSKGASKILKNLVVGKLRRCPCEGGEISSVGEKQWWMIWA